MSELIKDLGPIVGALGFIMTGVYFVTGKLMDKNQRLKDRASKAEASYVEKQVQHLREILQTFKGDVSELRIVLSAVQGSINHLNETMATTSTRQENLTQKLEDFASEVKDRIETLERGEMIPIGNGKYIIRGSKK